MMQHKPTFLNSPRPIVTSMVIKNTPDEARYAIKNSIYEGADAIALQLCRMKPELKTEENLRDMCRAAAGRPIYVTNYRGIANEGLTDEECMDTILLALKCGATLADIMGDTFSQDELQLTYDEVAVKRQMELIDKIHAMGKEVLMSSHFFKFLPAEKIIEMALEQRRRGADIVKLVGGSNSEEEMIENFRITTLLKKELDCPFIFLTSGTHSKLQRMIGPALGCFGYFSVLSHDDRAVVTQPTVRAAKAVRDNLDFMPDIDY